MKLTKAQQMIIDRAHNAIDRARETETYEEYFIKYEAIHMNGAYNTPEKMKSKDLESWNNYKSWWEKERNGIVLTHANSRTLEALERLGLIEIIVDGGTYTDEIKVLNY